MPHADGHDLRNIPAAAEVTDTVNIHAAPGPVALPRIIAVRTRGPSAPHCSILAIPRAVYQELDPINLTAASLYRAVVYASASATRMLDLNRHVFQPIAWFHDWAGEHEALADVLAAAALLERHGWLVRQRLPDSVERWTPLGRDRPRLPPQKVDDGPVDRFAKRGVRKAGDSNPRGRRASTPTPFPAVLLDRSGRLP